MGAQAVLVFVHNIDDADYGSGYGRLRYRATVSQAGQSQIRHVMEESVRIERLADVRILAEKYGRLSIGG